MVQSKSTNIQGQKLEPPADLQVRRLKYADRMSIRRWMADIDLVRHTVVVPEPRYAVSIPYGQAAADRYLDGMLMAHDRWTFAIESGGTHIGNMGLKDVRLEERTAECFIEICEPAYRRRGLAFHAMCRLLDFALLEKELTQIFLGVMEFNSAAIQLYQKLGFSFCGEYGKHWADEKYWQVRKMEITQDEWVFHRPSWTDA